MEGGRKWERPPSVPVPTVWHRFESKKKMANGKAPKFRIQDYSEEWKDAVVHNMVNCFVRDEPLCKSLKMIEDEASVEEFKALFLSFLERKMGLIAIVENLEELGDESLPALAGCNITAVVTSEEPHGRCASEKMQKIFDAIEILERKKNCFEHYQVSEFMYALGLSVNPAYRGHGLGVEILKSRFPLCRATGVKVTVTVFTAAAAQRSAEKAGFETLAELPYSEHKDERGRVIFDVEVPKSMKLMGALSKRNRKGGAITNMSKFVELLTQYIDDLQVEGSYATGQIDTDEKYADFRAALKNFGYNFTIRSSRKENCSVEGKKGRTKSENGKEEESNGKKDKKLPGRGSLMFKSSSDVSVPFFGSPFVVETTIYFTCSQGIKYYGSKQYPDEMFREGDPLSKKRRKPKLTQKIGCQAKMTVKKIKVFTGEEYYVSRDNWREKKVAIDQLKSDFLSEKKIDSVARYCVVISLDASHNHEAKIKVLKRPKQSQFDPARKVLKLHEQFQDALVMLNSELITKCTNISILTGCCNSLKSIINQLKDSIEREDGVPLELITAAIDKITQKQLRSAALLEKKNLAAKKKQLKTEKVVKVEEGDAGNGNPVVTKVENNENNQVIELSNIIEGTQVIWDPVNVSWVQDGQIIVQDSSGGTPGSQRTAKEPQQVLVQRRTDDGAPPDSASDQNIGVITQGGQNYTILQHGTNVHLPNIGVSVPFTMAKVVHPTTILTSNVKKTGKRGDVGVTAIAIPAGVEWNQQNWGQITQVVSSDGQFANFPAQTIWNISQ